MKKIYSLVAVVMAMIVAAVPAEAKILRFGVKAGLNVNSMSLNNTMEKVFDADNNCGWNAGVMAEVQVPVIGICADVSVMYSRLNQKMDLLNSNKEGVTAEDLAGMPNNFGKNFLEIPIHLKYKFNIPVVSNFFSPYLLTGPSFALNLNKKTFEDVRNRKCQTSWDFGLGFEVVRHLQIQGAYCLGMNNIAKYWNELDVQNGVKVKNNYWNLSVAYLF